MYLFNPVNNNTTTTTILSICHLANPYFGRTILGTNARRGSIIIILQFSEIDGKMEECVSAQKWFSQNMDCHRRVQDTTHEIITYNHFLNLLFSYRASKMVTITFEKAYLVPYGLLKGIEFVSVSVILMMITADSEISEIFILSL